MGFKIIPGINTIFNTLRFHTHGQNCFTMPKYLATSAFNPSNRELFYAYLYLYSHYDLLSLVENSQQITRKLCVGEYDLEQFEQYVLTKKLGLELAVVDIGESLCERICKAIDCGFPVFVPTDQGEYFYWESYHQQVMPHLLLVKGYNTETNIFVVHDGVQNAHLNRLLVSHHFELGDVYSEFYVPAAMLEQANRYYNKHHSYLQGQIQIMRQKGRSTVRTATEAFMDISLQLEPHLGNLPALLASKFKNLEQEGKSQTKIEALYVNSQQVLAKTLITMLPKNGVFIELREDLETSGMHACMLWKKFLTALSVMERKGRHQTDALSQLRAEIVEAESKFLQLLYTAGEESRMCLASIS